MFEINLNRQPEGDDNQAQRIGTKFSVEPGVVELTQQTTKDRTESPSKHCRLDFNVLSS